MKAGYIYIIAVAGLLLFSCNSKPEPFMYGKDICHLCKMGIIDPKFGCEVITKKGKIYKFDDVICIARFLHSGTIEEKEIKKKVVINFEKENDFLAIETAYFVVAPGIKSPMGSNTAAFLNKESAEKFLNSQDGQKISWSEILKRAE